MSQSNKEFRGRENVNVADGNKKKLFSVIYKNLKLGSSKIKRFVRWIYNTRLYVAVKRIKYTSIDFNLRTL